MRLVLAGIILVLGGIAIVVYAQIDPGTATQHNSADCIALLFIVIGMAILVRDYILLNKGKVPEWN